MLGNNKVVVYDTQQLEQDTFFPSAHDQIPVSGGGPTGLVLDEPRNRLYVLTRFDNGISIIDTHLEQEIAHLTMHNPEPPCIVAGAASSMTQRSRPATATSPVRRATSSATKTSLAWDLGDPEGDVSVAAGHFPGCLLSRSRCPSIR